jgi:hypothetical protein
MIAAASEQVWTWDKIPLKVDLIRFPSSPEPRQFDSACDWGGCHDLKVWCCRYLACARPLPFWCSSWFLSETRVHVFAWSKQDGHELKNRSWIVMPLPRLLNGRLMRGVKANCRIDRTSSRHCIGDCRRIKIGVDMGLDRFESRLDMIPIES